MFSINIFETINVPPPPPLWTRISERCSKKSFLSNMALDIL